MFRKPNSTSGALQDRKDEPGRTKASSRNIDDPAVSSPLSENPNDSGPTSQGAARSGPFAKLFSRSSSRASDPPSPSHSLNKDADESGTLVETFRHWRTGLPPGHIKGAGTWESLGKAIKRVADKTPLKVVHWEITPGARTKSITHEDNVLRLLFEKGQHSLVELSLAVDLDADEEEDDEEHTAVCFHEGALAGLSKCTALEGLWTCNVDFTELPDLSAAANLTTIIVHYNDALVRIPTESLAKSESLKRMSLWGCTKYDKTLASGISALSTDTKAAQLDMRAAKKWRRTPHRPE